MTQCAPVGHVGGVLGKQALFVSGEMVPLLSHPHVTVDVTFSVLAFCPLFW